MPVTVLQTDASLVTTCNDCDVPGYLIIRPVKGANLLSECPAFSSELGHILGRIELAVMTATGAIHVYIARFSEASNAVHFHILPRTVNMTGVYLSETGMEPSGLTGPGFFSWARERYHFGPGTEMSKQTAQVAESIRKTLETQGQ